MRPRRWGLLPIVAVVFTDTLGYAIVVPIIPFALGGQGVAAVAIGGVFAAFSLCQLITAPLFGRLSDRIGRRPVLVLSQAGSVAGFALLALSSAYPVVLISRVVDGCSAGNLSVCYAMVVDSDSEDVRRRGVPALGAATGAGILAGLGLGSVLVGFGLTVAAVVAMLLSFASLVFTGCALPETRRRGSADLGVVAALRLPALRSGSLFVALCAVLQAAFFLTLPAYLASALGLPAQETVALIAVLIGLAAAFQLAVLPRLLGRLRPRATAQVLVVVALSAAGLAAVTDGPLAVLTTAAAFGLAAAALAPASALLLVEGSPDAPRGLVMGLNASAATMGQILGPIAGYAAFGLGGVRGVALICLTIGLCTALGLRGLGQA